MRINNFLRYFLLDLFLILSSIKDVSMTPKISLARFFRVKNVSRVKSQISSLVNTGKVQFLVLSLQFGLMYLLQYCLNNSNSKKYKKIFLIYHKGFLIFVQIPSTKRDSSSMCSNGISNSGEI